MICVSGRIAGFVYCIYVHFVNHLYIGIYVHINVYIFTHRVFQEENLSNLYIN